MGGRRPGRRVLVCLVVLAVVALGGAASAFWSGVPGSGTGSGATGTTTAVSLGPGTPEGSLYPGGQANVLLTVSNPNTSPVFIGSLVLDAGQGTGGYAVDAGHSGCSVATLSYTTQTNGGAGWTVPAKVGTQDGTLPITLVNALAMGAGAANACQGASSTVYLSAVS